MKEMKLIIGTPKITQHKETEVRVELSLNSNVDKIELWYKFPNSYYEYFNENLADSYIVGLLIYAMQRGLDIETELCVSDILLDRITKYLIPFLCKINPNLKPIRIIAKPLDVVFDGKHSGTGISCGVDSLSSVIYHGEDEFIDSQRIDTLSLLNTGYFGFEENNQEKYNSYSKRSIDFCDKFGYNFFSLDTNLRTITDYNFLSAHTYLTCSTILLFQKYFKNYYYSSGYTVYDFKPIFADPAYYDVFLLDCISTRSLRFISSCCTMTRIEKTELISRYPNILKELYVCTSGDPSHNCSKCEKCQRTMLALDALGKDEMIGIAFDAKIYKKQRIAHYAYMLRHQSSPYYKEIKDELRKRHKTVPFLSYLYIWPTNIELVYLYKLISGTTLAKIIKPLYYLIKNKKK